MRRSAVASAAADPDVGRRVLQCHTCGLARAWTGRQAAIDLGWCSRWKDERREWFCPTCCPPAPVAAAPQPIAALPWVADVVRRSLATGPKHRRARVAIFDLLVRLAEQAPTQCALTLATVEPVLERRRVSAAAWWRERLEEVRAMLRPAGASPVERTQVMFEGVVAPPAPAPARCPSRARRGAA